MTYPQFRALRSLDKGKPSVTGGRKAHGSDIHVQTAGLPKVIGGAGFLSLPSTPRG